MGKRRDAGQIRQNKSGSWSAIYTTPDGRRVSAGSYSTKRAAEAALRAELTDIKRGEWFDESKGLKPFAEVAEEYFRTKSDVRPTTLDVYRSSYRSALLPTFGHLAVGEITIKLIDQWWADLAGHPVKRRNAYFMLRPMLAMAVRYGYLRTNPAMIAKPGAEAAKPRPTFTVGDFRLAVAMLSEDARPVVLALFGAHLRIGEACGLNREDFDPATGLLTISHQLSRTGERTPTKTGQVRSDPPRRPIPHCHRRSILGELEHVGQRESRTPATVGCVDRSTCKELILEDADERVKLDQHAAEMRVVQYPVGPALEVLPHPTAEILAHGRKSLELARVVPVASGAQCAPGQPHERFMI